MNSFSWIGLLMLLAIKLENNSVVVFNVDSDVAMYSGSVW